jgi:CO/xanthine dehydrogenase FAD-binding subunit
MHHTHYHRPASVAEATKLARQHPDDRIVAGGQSILPSMRLGLLSGGLKIASLFSDMRLKTDAEPIGYDENGVRWTQPE